MGKYTKETALILLRNQYAALCAAGEDRYPRRTDFSDKEVCAIKAFFGPWPRALEAAGIKPVRSDDRLARNREKRIRAKRNRRNLPKTKQKTDISDGYTADGNEKE